jgi:hypothetical protein
MRRTLPFLVLFAFFVAGCAKPEAAFLGKWRANAPAKTGNARTDAMMADMASSMIIEFKADRVASFAVQTQTIPCTYTVADKVATLTMTPSAGAAPAASKPLTLTLSADGKMLTADGNGQQMTFSKI